jgi:hypothetical protein
VPSPWRIAVFSKHYDRSRNTCIRFGTRSCSCSVHFQCLISFETSSVSKDNNIALAWEMFNSDHNWYCGYDNVLALFQNLIIGIVDFEKIASCHFIDAPVKFSLIFPTIISSCNRIVQILSIFCAIIWICFLCLTGVSRPLSAPTIANSLHTE